jgi:hypothetical protein
MPSEKSRESEEDIVKPDAEGKPPRPATEPAGAQWSVKNGKTATDPGSGAQRPGAPNPSR